MAGYPTQAPPMNGLPTQARAKQTPPANFKSRNSYFASPHQVITPENNAPNNNYLRNLSNEGFEWRRMFEAYAAPGTIIFTEDGTSRINNRAMVVLRKNGRNSVTGFSFCLHETLAIGYHKTHRRLKRRSTRAAQPQATTSLVLTTSADGKVEQPPIEIHLLPLQKIPVQLQPNIYLDCEELWTIEGEVEVTVLGHVDPALFVCLREDARQLFTDPPELQRYDTNDTARYRSPPPILELPPPNRPHAREEQDDDGLKRRRDRRYYDRGDGKKEKHKHS